MSKKIKSRGTFFVYILECRDGTFYTGYANDLEKRLKEHNEGKRGAKYTRGRRPVRVVWKKEYKELKSALKTERTIKGLTILQKELLVGGRRLDKVLVRAQSSRGKFSVGIFTPQCLGHDNQKFFYKNFWLAVWRSYDR